MITITIEVHQVATYEIFLYVSFYCAPAHFLSYTKTMIEFAAFIFLLLTAPFWVPIVAFLAVVGVVIALGLLILFFGLSMLRESPLPVQLSVVFLPLVIIFLYPPIQKLKLLIMSYSNKKREYISLKTHDELIDELLNQI